MCIMTYDEYLKSVDLIFLLHYIAVKTTNIPKHKLGTLIKLVKHR